MLATKFEANSCLFFGCDRNYREFWPFLRVIVARYRPLQPATSENDLIRPIFWRIKLPDRRRARRLLVVTNATMPPSPIDIIELFFVADETISAK
jgi:hypothetical protein